MAQYTYRKDIYKGAAQARRLIAAATLSSEVKYFTVVDEAGTDGQPVAYRLASTSFQVGLLTIAPMQAYYLIPCGRTGRYYVVTEVDGEWVSSCKDARPDHIATVMEYRQEASTPAASHDRSFKQVVEAMLDEQYANDPRSYRVVEEYGHFYPEAIVEGKWEKVLDTSSGWAALALRFETEVQAWAWIASQSLEQVA